MNNPVIVTLSDVRSLKYCSRGTRDFFVHHGLDWATFIKQGLPVEQFELTGDVMALKVAEVARGRKQ